MDSAVLGTDIRELEAKYRAVLEVTGDGLVIHTVDGVIVEANPAFCAMNGYTQEELVGQRITTLIHPNFHVLFREFVRTIGNGGSRHARVTNVRKDGTSFPVDVHGTLLVYNEEPHIVGVARDVTEQVQAYEILEQRVQERTRELSTLLDVSRNVSSTLDLQPLLGLILDQLKTVVNFDGATVMAVEGEALVNLYRQGPGRTNRVIKRHFAMPLDGALWNALQRGEPVLIGDVRGDTPLADEYRCINADVMDTTLRYVRSWMGVPMILKDRVAGILSLASGQLNLYGPHEASLVRAIANQAAVAMENARLYQKAQQLAVLEERQRLSRELHDSVSQALYSTALGIKTSRTWLDRDPPRAAEPLEFALAQAEMGMVEMRALIFELRPESLEQEGLVPALAKQVAALIARHKVPVHSSLCDEPDVPLPVKEAVYRIAQEALHNTIKHAGATEVRVSLAYVDDEILLEIQDDGKGFDTDASFPGHLGLHSMKERAMRLGGTLEVESALGAGTCICVRIARS